MHITLLVAVSLQSWALARKCEGERGQCDLPANTQRRRQPVFVCEPRPTPIPHSQPIHSSDLCRNRAGRVCGPAPD